MKRGRGRPRKELDWKVLAAEYQAGATLAALSAKHGACMTTICRGVRSAGVKMRKKGRRLIERKPRIPKPPRIDWPAVIAAYATESVASIAKKTGVAPATISAGLLKHGVPFIERRGAPTTPEQIVAGLAEAREIRSELRKAGMSQQSIAKRLGVTRQAVSLALLNGGYAGLRARIAAELRKADLGR